MAYQFATDTNITLPSSETILNSLAYSIAFWFKVPSKSGEGHTFHEESGSQFDRDTATYVAPTDANFVTPSKLVHRYRADGGGSMESATDFDDDQWHKALIVRRAADDFEMFVDGNSEATNTTDWGVNFGETPDIFLGTNSGGTWACTGSMARLAVWVGDVLTWSEANTFLTTAVWPVRPNYWIEMTEQIS